MIVLGSRHTSSLLIVAGVLVITLLMTRYLITGDGGALSFGVVGPMTCLILFAFGAQIATEFRKGNVDA